MPIDITIEQKKQDFHYVVLHVYTFNRSISVNKFAR